MRPPSLRSTGKRPALRFEPLEPRTVLATGLVISEFMASNGSAHFDEDGDSSDWIEIFNGTSAAVDLDGWFLTDSESELDRWEFPDVTLDAGGYLVVFASSKDRRDPSGELHTNFSLDADGEYLGLVEPDGETVAHEYSPTFGPQRSDISYGLAQSADSVIEEGATWSYFVPSSGALGNVWQDVSFDDGSWDTGPTSLGYGVQGTGFHVRRVSASGSFGQVNTLSRSDMLLALPVTSPSVAYSAEEVTPVVNFLDTGGDGHFGTNLPFPGDRPGDDNQYTVQATGTIIIPESGVYTFGTSSDDGVRLRIDEVNRILDDSAHAPEDRFTTVSLAAGLHDVEVTFFEIGGGSELELFARRGSYSSFNDGFRLVGDVANGGLTVLTDAAGSITTDISDVLDGVASSLYMRHEFTLDEIDNLGSMTLSVRYSDGFVAYLNGVEVARRGVQGDVDVTWNATAAGDRTVDETLEVERIALGQFLSVLREGENVLAIQALKSSASDDTVLIEPFLTIADDGGPSPFYFTEATPGEPNGEGILGWPDAPRFNVEHGLYDAPQTVTMQTETPGATIRYTTDGSSPLNGALYTGPITVDSTTTLRAVATLEDHLPSDVTTQTYIFLEDVIRQSPSSAVAQGFPSSNINGQSLEYGMDQTVVNNVHGPQATIDSLTALPSISLVTDFDNLFDPQNGIYVNAGSRGRDWERPVSVELVNPDGSEGFQIDAGLRIRGGFSRSGGNPKHAFRLFFRGEYDGPHEYAWFGDEGVDVFHNMDLRTSQNYSWSFQNSPENTFEREVFSRDAQRDMGHAYTRSRYYHLYLNGHYWGIFQTQERPEAEYAATYFGGEPEDYDVVKAAGNAAGYTIEATDGKMDAWAQLWDLAVDLAQNPNTQADNYWTMQGRNPNGTRNPDLPALLDVDHLIEYLLITFYTGNTDAPLSNFLGNDRPNNWFGIYNRERADRGFQFFQHDAEHSLATSASSTDRTGPFLSGNRYTLAYSNPQFLHQHLMAHPEYRLRFADVAQKHLQNDGTLTYEKSLDRFNARVDEASPAIPAEQARWGSTSLGVPQYEAQINEVRQFFVNRSEVLLGQLRADGLYPALGAPRFNQHGGRIAPGFQLVMESPSGEGTIYYTLDGSDPRLFDGSLNPASQIFDGQTESHMLLPRGSTWKYRDTGQNLGTAWKEPGYDDAAWASGPAQLGYGDGDEATVVGFGGNSGNKHITTYFRRTFDVDASDPFSTLVLRLLRDDGAIVYLNGEEVVRSNMPGTPGTPVSYTTTSAGVVGGSDENTFFDFNIPPDLLVPGENTIAVEIHQTSPTSSDISFDLELVGNTVSGGVVLDETSRVRARIRDGNEWSALNSADFTVNTVPAGMDNLRVVEINYNPYDPLPQFGEPEIDNDFFEFLELLNTSESETLDLDGVRFTDGIAFDFTGSAVTNLTPGERVLVVKDLAAFESRYGTGHNIAGTFQNATNLANDGETIELVDAEGMVIQSFTYDDSGAWPGRADGTGSSLVVKDLARDFNDPGNWRSSAIFGGTPGADEPARFVDVIVNEVLAHTDPPLEDSIELYNTTDQPVDVGGWWICDSSENLVKFQIPDQTVIPAGGYLVFTAADFNPGGGANGTDFALSAAGDDVWLMEADATNRGSVPGRPLRFADRVEFAAQLTGVSLGRIPSGNPGAELFPLASPSLGSANGAHRPGEVVFSELNYHPGDAPAGSPLTEAELEFVELYNRSGIPLDLSGWRVRGGVDLDLPQGTALGAGQTLVLVGFDPADAAVAGPFRSAYGIDSGVRLVGPFMGRLSNGGEAVELLAPTDPPAGQIEPVFYLVDRVTYSDGGAWPDEADGEGPSLHRLSAENYGDAAASWRAEEPSPGSTEFDEEPVLAGDYNGNGLVEQQDLDLVLANWGRPAAQAPSTWVNDLPEGNVDQTELDRVLANWGNTALARAEAPAAPQQPLAVHELEPETNASNGEDPCVNLPAERLSGEGLVAVDLTSDHGAENARSSARAKAGSSSFSPAPRQDERVAEPPDIAQSTGLLTMEKIRDRARVHPRAVDYVFDKLLSDWQSL